MDKAFIEKNQIVERYLTGKLPFKGVQDFERYCHEHPEVLEEIHFAEAVHKGVRLLEASGKAGEWQEPRTEWWRQPAILFGLVAAVLALAIGAGLLYGRTQDLQAQVDEAQKRLEIGPLRPPALTRTVRLTPDRAGPSSRIHLTVPARERPELLEIRVDVSFARQNAFRLTLDKRDQARAGTIHNLLRDSNGQLRLTVNTSGLHAGDYRAAIEGVTSRGQLVPVGWFNVRVMK